MKTAQVKITGISPLSQGKYYASSVPKLEKESAKDYEERTWMHRLHVNEDDYVFIPPMALKNCLAEAAKFLSMQIPGKGKATYTKHFEAGVLVTEPAVLNVKKEDVKPNWLFVPSDGVRGSGKRVEKCFPIIHQWETEAIFFILDETVTKEVFLKVLEEAGKFIGIGVFRPRNNGFFGRFKIELLSWN